MLLIIFVSVLKSAWIVYFTEESGEFWAIEDNPENPRIKNNIYLNNLFKAIKLLAYQFDTLITEQNY